MIIHSLGFRLHFLFPSYRCISCKQAICNAGRGNQQRLWRQSATHVEATEANNQRIRIQPASKTMQVSIHTTSSLVQSTLAYTHIHTHTHSQTHTHTHTHKTSSLAQSTLAHTHAYTHTRHAHSQCAGQQSVRRAAL